MSAGRIVKRLKRNINPGLFKETRCGPSNHPSRWLNITLDQEEEDCVSFSKLSSKILYKALKAREFVRPKAQEKWAQILNLSDDFNWTGVWGKIHQNNVLDVKDKDVIFRLCHRILPTRDKLVHMGITDKVECPLCKSATETTEHLFLYCKTAIEPWLYVEHLIRKQVGCSFFCLTDCSIICSTNLSFVSMIIVAMMIRVIWRCRCDLVFNEDKTYTKANIVQSFKQALKNFLVMESDRLKTSSFNQLYKFLCFFQDDRLIFKF